MAPTRFYVVLFLFFMAALLVGFLYFLGGMGDASYLVSDGIRYGLHFFDKPRYDIHVQGIIFTLTFLAAAILMLILIMLPDQRLMEARAQASAPPQPRARPAAAQQQAAPQPVQRSVAAPAAQAQPTMMPQAMAEAVDGGGVAQTVTAVESAGVVEEAPQAITTAPSSRTEPKPSIEDELLESPADDILDDIPDGRYDDTGEEDVVYGNGRVSDDSVWEFIHNYPDSAVKFLYRKTLENKGLSPTDEDIYRRWEMRGMTRTRVRQFVLEIMGWKSLPDDYPHNIWKQLRDQIFEIKSRIQA